MNKELTTVTTIRIEQIEKEFDKDFKRLLELNGMENLTEMGLIYGLTKKYLKMAQEMTTDIAEIEDSRYGTMEAKLDKILLELERK